jgi:succinoglycan biosynthesis protein ExoV
MKLIYHKGDNFGDALNPIIFNKLLPDFFDNKESSCFLGIGSILGLFNPTDDQKKIIVFSSGFAAGDENTYGKAPQLDSKYEILCIRGPLTASLLNIPKNKAISDGALLLPFALEIPKQEKIYAFSYIPHVGSLDVYDDWQNLMKSIGIHLIDPRKDVNTVLKEMEQSKIILTEAMHGAIMADTLQIPWIPVKTIKTINSFKWKDYLASVELSYEPNSIKTIYSRLFLTGLFENKLSKFKLDFLKSFFASIYHFYQKTVILPRVKKQFINLKKEKTFLCKKEILIDRQNRLMNLINELKKTD